MDEDNSLPAKTGLYERTVQKIVEWAKPHLHERTQAFVAKSVDEYAKGDPKYARMIEFEVRRRGDGAGLTQDVAEPILWASIKTAVAIPISILAHSIDNKKFKMIGYGAALGLVLNNVVELLRVIPRYTAGLQGSLEMAKDRWRALQETGVDPFDNQKESREINRQDMPGGRFAQGIGQKPLIVPTSLLEQAKKSSEPGRE